MCGLVGVFKILLQCSANLKFRRNKYSRLFCEVGKNFFLSLVQTRNFDMADQVDIDNNLDTFFIYFYNKID